MTIVIGYLGAGGMVMSTDSQATFYPSTRKDPDIKKIVKVKFADGSYALVGRSGTLDTAEYFHEIFESIASETKVVTQRTIADVAEIAFKQTRTKLLNQFRDDAFGPDDTRTHLLNYGCELMLGYVFNETPYIYTIGLDSCIAIRCNKNFKAIGSGSNIADYILTGFDFSAMEPSVTGAIAAYAIEMCKTYDSACGGRIQMAAVIHDGKWCEFFGPRSINEHEQIARATSDKVREALVEILLKSTQGKVEPPASE